MGKDVCRLEFLTFIGKRRVPHTERQARTGRLRPEKTWIWGIVRSSKSRGRLAAVLLVTTCLVAPFLVTSVRADGGAGGNNPGKQFAPGQPAIPLPSMIVM